MAKKNINEAEDNSINAVIHQGKSVEEWQKLLKDFNFTQEQIMKMIRAGEDLGRLLQGLNEAESDFDNPVFKDEEFFFTEKEKSIDEASIKDYVMPNIEFKILDKDGNEVKSWHVDIDQLDNATAYVGDAPALVSILLDKNLRDKYVGVQLVGALFVDGVQLPIEKSQFESALKAVKDRIDKIKGNTIDFTKIHETTDEEAALDESSMNVGDVVTVQDFIDDLAEKADMHDKIAFVFDNKTYDISDIRSKSGVTVIEFDEQNKLNEMDDEKMNELDDAPMTVADLMDELKDSTKSPSLDLVLANVDGNPYYITKVVSKKNAVLLRCRDVKMNESIINEEQINGDFLNIDDLRCVAQRSNPNDDAWMSNQIVGIVNGNIINFKDIERVEREQPGKEVFFLLDGKPNSKKQFEAYRKILMNKVNENMNEGKNWYKGGYGGTGRSYRSLDHNAPRGAEIGWFSVEDIDPKAKGKMPGWRCGPSNFPIKNDLFFPNRTYKQGVMVMKNKYVKAGPLSGIVQIAIPSYFEIIKTQDPEGLKVLEALKIPLDLTFGMDPNDDYSMTYTIKS